MRRLAFVLSPAVPTKQTPDVQVSLAVGKTTGKGSKSGAAASATVVVPIDSRSAAVASTPPLEPLEIADAQVVSVTSSSARITWKTNVPAQAQTAFGLDAPTIWTQPSGDSLVEHESLLAGLEFGTTYQVYLHAIDEWNRATTATVTITTEGMPDRSVASTNGSQIVVDDRVFFPTAVWAQCSDGFNSNINDGINLFMGDGCSKDESSLPTRLDGRAYSIVECRERRNRRRTRLARLVLPGRVGRLPAEHRHAQGSREEHRSAAGRSHQLPDADEPLLQPRDAAPAGQGHVPDAMSIPDVVGFDLYPLQVWCRPAFGDVMDAQRELRSTSGGKPTFQWIEVAPMEQPVHEPQQARPDAADRARRDLARSRGRRKRESATSRTTGRSDRSGDRADQPEIKSLSPRCSLPIAAATSDVPAVRVSARTLNGATYVIAVNTAARRSRQRSPSTGSPAARRSSSAAARAPRRLGRPRASRHVRSRWRPRVRHPARRLVGSGTRAAKSRAWQGAVRSGRSGRASLRVSRSAR